MTTDRMANEEEICLNCQSRGILIQTLSREERRQFQNNDDEFKKEYRQAAIDAKGVPVKVNILICGNCSMKTVGFYT